MPEGEEYRMPVAKKIRGVTTYLHNLNLSHLQKMEMRLAELDQAVRKRIKKAGDEGYLKWVSKALENGAGIAHKWTTQEPKAPPLPYAIEQADGPTLYLLVDEASYYREYWSSYWTKKNPLVHQKNSLKLSARGSFC